MSFTILLCSCGGNKKSEKQVMLGEETPNLPTELKKYTINFDDPFFNSKEIVQEKSVKINSKSELKRVNIFDVEKFKFPFTWKAEIIPGEAIPLYKLKFDNLFVFMIAYGYGSTSNTSFDAFLFTYDLNGNFIDYKKLITFCYGKGDSDVFLKSNFARDYGSSGFSSIEIVDKTIYFNSSILRIYNSGTEELYFENCSYEILANGYIEQKLSNNYSGFFYRNGSYNTKLKDSLTYIISN